MSACLWLAYILFFYISGICSLSILEKYAFFLINPEESFVSPLAQQHQSPHFASLTEVEYPQ